MSDGCAILPHRLYIDIHKIAACSAIEIKELGGWNQKNYGHSDNMNHGVYFANKSDHTPSQCIPTGLKWTAK